FVKLQQFSSVFAGSEKRAEMTQLEAFSVAAAVSAAFPGGRRRHACHYKGRPSTCGVGDGLGVACGVVVGGLPQPVTPAAAFCRAAVPRLLRIATPIADWSSVIGPTDSAT